MEAINWVFVSLARLSPILVATDEIAHLSIVIFCCLLGFFFLRPVVANRGRSKVQKWNLEAREVNDSLYELHKPKGDPTIQVVFFHGLPFEESSEAHLSTWISGDGKCIWPKVWLAEAFPDAHILVVSYREGLRKGSAENFDMHIISENLISDLMQANIGQTPHCPVVLVGHSFGGLVIKKLCLHAHDTFKSSRNAVKAEKFLDNVRGVFYYSTPHRGCSDIGRARSVLSRPLFDYFTTLSKHTSRLNSSFQNLCTVCYPKWKIEGLGEMLAVETGIFRGIVVVREASARDGVNFNLDTSADHFSVCRPEKKTSRRFNALTTLLSSVCDNSKEEKDVAEKAVRQNWEFLPKQLVNMDVLVQEVKSRLQKFTTLGLLGMGGLGKSTLARAVFNDLSPAYEYSCFVPNIKLRKGDDVKKIVWEHMHRLGKKVEHTEDWSALLGKTLLLVVDDINNDRDITLLSHLVDRTSPQSRFIITSRRIDLRKFLRDTYRVPYLDLKLAEELFLSHAFPNKAIVPLEFAPAIRAIVMKCGGLPLTLEVIGTFLALNEDDEFWKQTLQALEQAAAIDNLEERLWATLRVSYDGLDVVAKQMFLDATTFFSERENGNQEFSLRMAKAAWREAYGTKFESLLWQTLVDKSLVYHVQEDERIKVHDQLLSLGRKIASEPSNSGRCRVWDETMALKLLQNNAESANQDIHALRLSNGWTGGSSASSRGELHFPSNIVHKLKELRYLEVDAPVLLDGGVEEISFPCKLVVLKWVGRLDPFNFALQDRLVVLHLDRVRVLPSSIGQLSALRFFIGDLGSVPDEFGNLSQLEHLEVNGCSMHNLRETFCKLSQLEYLKFSKCYCLHILPEEFGALSKLKVLEFYQCDDLRSLPETFGDLSALNRLVFRNCDTLISLSNSFGSLSALKYLEFFICELCALPNSFGHLSALKHLEILACHALRALPESFGHLPALKHLKIQECVQLQGFPDSFGHLSALEHLEIRECYHLEGLPDSFGNLFALKHLEIRECSHLECLPDSFGNLSALKHLEIRYCHRLRTFPFGQLEALEDLKLEGCQIEATSFGELSTLRHLELTDSGANILSVIPFSQLTQLQILKIIGGRNLIPIKKLPESLAGLTALTRLVLKRLCIRSIPDFMKSMQSLRTLELCVLPYVKEVPTWLEHASAAPLASSRKIFQVQENCFSLIHEDCEIISSDELITSIHENAMEKVSKCDYEGALADLCPANLQWVELRWQRFLLQESGIIRCQVGDLQGALEDLTAVSELLSDQAESDEHRSMYEFWRYRGYVNYLLEDLGRANDDGANAVRVLRTDGRFGERLASGFAKQTITYMDFRLAGETERTEHWKQLLSAHSEVMDKVTNLDFQGALAIWCDFDAKVYSQYCRVYFLQERGILKRMVGDLHGALEDLTTALEVVDENYELLKHRGYVKYLMGDDSGARKDAGRCMAIDPAVHWREFLGGLPVAFFEFRLKGSQGLEENLWRLSHKKVLEKAKEKEFMGALAIWDDFETRVGGCHHRVFFLQERGLLKRMAGDLDGALGDLTRALETDHDNYELLKHRGYVKYLMGDDCGAEKDAERCMAMDPVEHGLDCLGGFPVAFLEFRLKGRKACERNLRSFSHEKVMENVKEKEFLGALAIWDDFDASVCGCDDIVFFLTEKGILKRMAGDLHGALADLTAALEIDDDDENYELLKHRGYVKYLMGNDGGARKDAERCMAMDPVVDGPDCLGGLPVAFLEFRLKGRDECVVNLVFVSHKKVMVKVKQKEFLGALAIWDDMDTSVCGCNDRIRVFFLTEKGILKRMAGDLHGALEDLTAALEIDDDDENYELLKHLGYVKYLMGDDSGAREDAERCQAMDPEVDGPDCLGESPVAFLEFRLKGSEEFEENLFIFSHERVMEKVKEKEFVGALAMWDDFDARVCGYSDRVFFLQERGILKRMAGKLHGALEDLTAALEISGDEYECLKYRGYVKFLLGDIDGARKDAEKCLALGIKEADSSADYDSLGEFPVAFLEFKL